MSAIRDYDGVEHHIHYRRIPGYYNRSTYHVDIDHQHVCDVRLTSDATWSRSAVWSTYRPGVDWSVTGRVSGRSELFLVADRTRELAVKWALRKLAHETTPEWHERTQATLTPEEMASLATAINGDPSGSAE